MSTSMEVAAQAGAGKMPADEWRVRVDLAACYRLFDYFRMTDLIYTHISARVPGRHDHFLINPFGLMFDEITASCLVKVDVDGNVLEDSTGMGINPGGFTIHSAVHMARPDVQYVMHSHTPAGIAVASMERGLLPLTQHAMRFTNRLARHHYEGVYFTHEERQRLQASLGQRTAMLLHNHGLLVCQKSAVEAFDEVYYLERACQAQVALLSLGEKLIEPGAAAGEQVAAYMETPGRKSPQKAWDALVRRLDRIDPSYKT